MSASPCDLCGHDNFEIIGRMERHGAPLDTAVCTHCGLVRHAVVPSEEELNHFYSTT